MVDPAWNERPGRLMTAREFKDKLTRQWRQQSLGALLTALVGVIVFWSRLGQGLDHWSYDLLFLFGPKPAPEEVIVVRMNEQAEQDLHQRHGHEWDRGLHAGLLKRLTKDRARLVVFDL